MFAHVCRARGLPVLDRSPFRRISSATSDTVNAPVNCFFSPYRSRSHWPSAVSGTSTGLPSRRPFRNPVGAPRHQYPSLVRIFSTPMVRSTRRRFSNRAMPASRVSISSPVGDSSIRSVANSTRMPCSASAPLRVKYGTTPPREMRSTFQNTTTWICGRWAITSRMTASKSTRSSPLADSATTNSRTRVYPWRRM